MDVDRSHVVAMAEAARWAPSVMNTQPWRFRSRADGLAVMVDDSRGLPALDPTGRLRTISCGAAVSNAALASLTAGAGTRVQLLPDGPRGGTVARVVAVAPRVATVREQRLARGVRHRRSHRQVCPHEQVPAGLLHDLADTVADEGATLTVLDEERRRVLARLLLRAVREQEHRPELIAETHAWTRDGVERPVDGVLRHSLLPSAYDPGRPGPIGQPVHRRGHAGSVADARAVEEVATGTVVVLSTRTDTRRDHLVAGMALQRLLLHLTAVDLVAAFADHATEVRDTRDQVSAMLERPGAAQVVLRLGRAAVDVRVPGRRPLGDMLDVGDRPAVLDLRTHERTRS